VAEGHGHPQVTLISQVHRIVVAEGHGHPLVTLISAGAQDCCAFYQPLQIVQVKWANTIFRSQTGNFLLFFIQFIMHDHILSTAGDALTPFFFGHTLGFAKSKHGQKKHGQNSRNI
jgi:hypothetical protein